MKRILKYSLILLFLVMMNGCLNDTEEPDPKPKTPPPVPQLSDE